MSPKVPTPKEIREAAQAAAETAQTMASEAMRIPPASLPMISQVPDMIENLALATSTSTRQSTARSASSHWLIR